MAKFTYYITYINKNCLYAKIIWHFGCQNAINNFGITKFNLDSMYRFFYTFCLKCTCIFFINFGISLNNLKISLIKLTSKNSVILFEDLISFFNFMKIC